MDTLLIFMPGTENAIHCDRKQRLSLPTWGYILVGETVLTKQLASKCQIVTVVSALKGHMPWCHEKIEWGDLVHPRKLEKCLLAEI